MSIRTAAAGSRRAHSIPTHSGLRRHRRDVARWALAHGHPVARDALATIVGARAVMSAGTVSLRWTAEEVGVLLWSGLTNWCVSRGVRAPGDVVPTLTTYLRYLSGHRLLERDSDSMAVLRRAVADFGQQPDKASRSRHPAAGRRALAPVLPLY
ncbi:hypothetical protein BH10ACT3_BH10ACT3_16140 [soil metagenome]